MDFTESFTAPDGDLGTVTTDLTWSIVETDEWGITNNQASPRGSVRGLTSYARAEHDTDGTDQYAELKVYALVGNSTQGGPCVRYAAAANNSYMAMVDGGDSASGSPAVLLRRTDAGSRTTLAISAPVDITGLPKVLRVEVEGSTLRGFWDGVEVVTASDGTYTSNTRTGLYGHEHTGEGLGFVIDDFGAGDLGGATQQNLMPAIESSGSQGVIGEKLGALLETISIDSGIITPGAKSANLQVSTVSGNALGFVSAKANSLPSAISLDTAFGVEGDKLGDLTLATSLSSGVSFTRTKLASLQSVSEVATAEMLVSSFGQLLGFAVDNSVSELLASYKTNALTRANYKINAFSLSPGFSQLLGVAEAYNLSLVLEGSKQSNLSAAGERTKAQLLRVPGFQLLEVALETDEAITLTVFVLVLTLSGRAKIVGETGSSYIKSPGGVNTLLSLRGKARMQSGLGG